MASTLKSYVASYLAHLASIAFVIITQYNHGSKWLPLCCLLLTAGFFVYLYWKNEKLSREKKLLRMVLLIVFFQIAALVFIAIKFSEQRKNRQ